MIEPVRSAQKILIFPRGKFYIEKYGDWITFDDSFFSEISDAYESDALRKPFIDKNHELEESYGELSNPSVEDDGMYFECILNETGIELIQNRIYTSISPTFGELTDTTGKKWNNCLISVSLTNIPALQNNYPDLASQFSLMAEKGYKTFNIKELKMKNLEITRKLELTPEASDDAILMAIQKLIDEGATLEELASAKEKMIETLSAKIDELTKEKDEAIAQVEEMKAESEKKEFESYFVDALKGEVILPVEKDKYFEFFKKDREFCIDTMKKLSIKKNVGFTIHDSAISEEDKNIMISLKMDPSDKKDLELYKRVNGIK
jgi:hypothetical protein